MIILGDKHKFAELELNTIKKYFPNYVHISYKNRDLETVKEEIKQNLQKSKYELILLNTKAEVSNELINFLSDLNLNNTEYISLKKFFPKYLNKCYISNESSDLTYLQDIKPYSTINYIQKRLIDYIVSIPLIIVGTPLVIYSYFRIKKESPEAPIIFKQKRVGLKGKEFTCYKLRSMRTDVDFFNHYTQEDDPRIFPWGKFMRKSRIDELPQLWNVLKGDMHLIGPRAEWVELVTKYEDILPCYHNRHAVAPGITGWAQVNYPYGENAEDAKQKLMYDLYYIKYWSIWLDLKTIWKTVLVVLGKKGI